ncbi:transcriptional regulator [Lysinibacillus irui]|uniref:helix-turn-helix domain-containing protein n=1 Tax=Lysinibacillus irui TaxID=2998077 RepID=UPI003D2C58C7
MDYVKNFGIHLKAARERAGLTLSELGNLVGYSNPYLSQIESGKRSNPPSPELIRKFSEVLPDVSYGGLLEEAGYHELAKNEEIRSAYEDFKDELDDFEIDINVLHEKVRVIDEITDINNLLISKNIQPEYKSHPLTEQDRKRILTMLEVLFPEYQNGEE